MQTKCVGLLRRAVLSAYFKGTLYAPSGLFCNRRRTQQSSAQSLKISFSFCAVLSFTSKRLSVKFLSSVPLFGHHLIVFLYRKLHPLIILFFQLLYRRQRSRFFQSLRVDLDTHVLFFVGNPVIIFLTLVPFQEIAVRFPEIELDGLLPGYLRSNERMFADPYKIVQIKRSETGPPVTGSDLCNLPSR